MPSTLIPDILRAIVTDVMIILLIFTMSTPKYQKKLPYIITTVSIVVANLAVNLYFYATNNYSAVALADLLMLVLIAIVLKPLFKETVMQWCFSFVTVLNFYAAIVFITYYGCDFFPYPLYANTFLRALIFGIVVFVFWKKAGPLYHKVKEYWHVFSLLTVVLLINYLYYFFYGDVIEMMDDNFTPILLLVFLTLFIYIGIFFSLKIIIQKYELREENVKGQIDRKLLQKTTNEMKQRLFLMDDAVKQMRVANHDRRHFNAAIMELLEQGEIDKTLSLIKKQLEEIPQSPRMYCENTEVNAAVSYYAEVAKEKGIGCDIRLDIPQDIAVDSLELAMVVSNLMENAIQGISSTADKRIIKFIALYTGQIILEIENPYSGEVKTDENGFPISEKENHGIGTESVVSFAQKWNAELDYIMIDGIFKVQMMI